MTMFSVLLVVAVVHSLCCGSAMAFFTPRLHTPLQVCRSGGCSSGRMVSSPWTRGWLGYDLWWTV